jgi:gluconate 2-dehydrogenase gamma chain
VLQDSTSRRDFLAASGVALATLWLTADPEEVRASLAHAAHATTSPGSFALEALTAQQAADVEAIAAQIIPTDSTPGAREAHVVNFIDHSLANWAAAQRADFVKGLDELNAEAEKRWPGTGGFAKLSGEHQIELLTAWEKDKKPFFDAVRNGTVTGMFASPSYGGNTDKMGWKLLGFDDRGAWQPPFGDYDAEASKGASR